MTSIQQLLEAERARAERKYPTPVTLHSGVGLLQMKLFRFQQRSCGHMTDTDINCRREAQMCLLHIMAVSSRMLEEVLGVPSIEEYNDFNSTSL